MHYFQKKTNLKFKNKHIQLRRMRPKVAGFRKAYKATIGDILNLDFRIFGLLYFFEGLCIKIKYKNFVNPETSITLRNILEGVGVELSIAYFYMRIFFTRFDDYKRKRFFYSRSKLFFLRKKLNKHSRVR